MSKSVMDKFKKAFGLKADGSPILLFRGFVTESIKSCDIALSQDKLTFFGGQNLNFVTCQITFNNHTGAWYNCLYNCLNSCTMKTIFVPTYTYNGISTVFVQIIKRGKCKT